MGAPLSAPLAISGNGAIDAKQRDKERNTHPTTVLRFDDWEEVVVAEMDSLPEVRNFLASQCMYAIVCAYRIQRRYASVESLPIAFIEVESCATPEV